MFPTQKLLQGWASGQAVISFSISSTDLAHRPRIVQWANAVLCPSSPESEAKATPFFRKSDEFANVAAHVQPPLLEAHRSNRAIVANDTTFRCADDRQGIFLHFTTKKKRPLDTKQPVIRADMLHSSTQRAVRTEARGQIGSR